MLADEEQEGLFNSLDWIRYKVGVRYDANSVPVIKPGSIASGILCMWCNSIWIGILFTVALLCNQEATVIASLPFALSAITIMIEDWRNNENKA